LTEVWAALWLSFGVVFVAELGDKSQLMALSFASRFRALPVLAAIATASALIMLVSVGLGAAFAEVLPTRAIRIVAALAFFGFALWTLRGDGHEDDVESAPRTGGRSTFVVVAVAFFLAELGDKTMLATITLATQYGWFEVWLGATLGMVAVDALAIVIGRQLGERLPARAVRYGSAALFALVGTLLLVDVLL